MGHVFINGYCNWMIQQQKGRHSMLFFLGGKVLSDIFFGCKDLGVLGRGS